METGVLADAPMFSFDASLRNVGLERRSRTPRDFVSQGNLGKREGLGLVPVCWCLAHLAQRCFVEMVILRSPSAAFVGQGLKQMRKKEVYMSKNKYNATAHSRACLNK